MHATDSLILQNAHVYTMHCNNRRDGHLIISKCIRVSVNLRVPRMCSTDLALVLVFECSSCQAIISAIEIPFSKIFTSPLEMVGDECKWEAKLHTVKDAYKMPIILYLKKFSCRFARLPLKPQLQSY